jgi:hypothetical protein
MSENENEVKMKVKMSENENEMKMKEKMKNSMYKSGEKKYPKLDKNSKLVEKNSSSLATGPRFVVPSTDT